MIPMFKQNVGMTKIYAKGIAELFLIRCNPYHWDGSGVRMRISSRLSRATRSTAIGFARRQTPPTIFIWVLMTNKT